MPPAASGAASAPAAVGWRPMCRLIRRFWRGGRRGSDWEFQGHWCRHCMHLLAPPVKKSTLIVLLGINTQCASVAEFKCLCVCFSVAL